MFEKKITFITQKVLKDIDIEKPTPIKLNIPEWYKKLQHTVEKQTVKGCMPFLDTLTTGYVLKTDQDVYLNHNYIDHEGNPKTTLSISGLSQGGSILADFGVNLNFMNNSGHRTFQIENSPILKKNGDMYIHKMENPWIIKTPPGYSCLFVSPLNNGHDIIEIIPGIVDTDKYTLPINFPYIIKGAIDKNVKTIIKKGTPYVQIIPFKKESWKMNIEYVSSKYQLTQRENFFLKIIHRYRDKFWNKVKWS